MSSLTAMAMRFSARKALDGATFAEGRVYDSAVAPINEMASEESAAFIVISTEDEEASITSRDILNGNRTVDLVLEVAIARPVVAEADVDGDGTPETDIVIPATDAGMELSLSLIVRQMQRALFEGESPWCDTFRRFAVSVPKISNRRGVGNKDGARFAARQLIFTIEPISEPPFGHVPEGGEPWGDLIIAMESEPDLASIALLVKQAITGSPEIADWDRGRSDQGLTYEAAEKINITFPGYPDEEPPALDGGDLVEVSGDE